MPIFSRASGSPSWRNVPSVAQLRQVSEVRAASDDGEGREGAVVDVPRLDGFDAVVREESVLELHRPVKAVSVELRLLELERGRRQRRGGGGGRERYVNA